jgi:hypothetical protein
MHLAEYKECPALAFRGLKRTAMLKERRKWSSPNPYQKVVWLQRVAPSC